jgi:hypothetical protein
MTWSVGECGQYALKDVTQQLRNCSYSPLATLQTAHSHAHEIVIPRDQSTGIKPPYPVDRKYANWKLRVNIYLNL